MRAAAALPLTLATLATAATHRVPDEYPTINAGLDAAAAGDTVLVAPGTYTDFEVRDIPGGGTRSACAYLVDGVVLLSESGPDVTTIDMQEVVTPQANVILATFFSSEDTIVEGFTITGIRPGRSAVFVNESDRVTLRGCTFRDMGSLEASAGTAIWSRISVLSVLNCEFRNLFSASAGGIFHTSSDIEVRDSSFRDCKSRAILLSGQSAVGQGVIDSCEFIENASEAGGGAVLSSNYDVVISNCLFRGNVSLGTGSSGSGGAVEMGGFQKTVENSVFLFNRTERPSSTGGALWLSGGGDTVRGNTFYGNSKVNEPGGGSTITMLGTDSALMNNIIAASTGGEAVSVFAESPATGCNVFWENADGIGEGYTPGPMDRVVDPLFCDSDAGDWTLQKGSPCLPDDPSGCGLVGALGQGCAPVALEPLTWGRVKGLYRIDLRDQ